MSKVQLNIEVDSDLLERYDDYVKVCGTSRTEEIVGDIERAVMGHEKVMGIFQECLANDPIDVPREFW